MDFQGIKKQVLSLLGQIYLHESEDEDNYVHVARARLAQQTISKIEPTGSLSTVMLELKNLKGSPAFKDYFSSHHPESANRHFDNKLKKIWIDCQKCIDDCTKEMKDWEEDLKVRQQTLDAANTHALPILAAIKSQIISKVQGEDFKFGIFGSSYSIKDEDTGNIYPVPRRVYKIMSLLKDPRFSPAEVLEEINAIRDQAASGYQSSTLYYFGRTQDSTNRFLAELNCEAPAATH
ncbi:hypothetical protein AVI51_08080 [Piscirickettsia salmonis]|uniref:Uncharacterized protein n=1 Tax=Piscirickettsia salmonis TaxID=1238 RepID=A0A9Q5VFV7_PISSA|nr:hypothetical protein [Piscirickettsia salmonis]ALA23977.1 acetate kinase [Piscirickettsia salmonis]APS44389.1 hypothetical protein AVI48_08440 [Piscirickettsia salmonis]APS47750.1 hypothetical protein AVI49_09050 [Piscirickettsia salmonis]APS50820.1 hypothetical protein AVI50_08170 [Piscirickettsia salmonis]APS54024.1 hypothetical protein AVI51_08080 [Piscirickettsia salmonis]